MIATLVFALALVPVQDTPPHPVQDALLWGRFDLRVEHIADPAAAGRWREMQARARSMKSRLPPPVDSGGSASRVHGKREQYERIFYATASPAQGRQPADEELWFGLEAADLVQGMRPCYEWEGSADCPAREAEFAEFWMKREGTRDRMAPFLTLFAGHRWICAADGYEYDRKPALAATARERSSRLLKQVAAGSDALFRYVAERLLAAPKCWMRKD